MNEPDLPSLPPLPTSSPLSSSSSSSPHSTDQDLYSFHLLGFSAASVFIIAIVGTFGNLLAALSLLRSKKLRQSPSTSFMINLPACLLPVCAVGMPSFGIGCIQLQYYGSILYPDSLCVALFTMGLMLSQVHIHTLAALAFNRLVAVVWPGKYKRMMQPRWVKLYLMLLWLYSILLWLPLAFGIFGQLVFNEEELMVSMEDESGSRLKRAVHVFFTFVLPILFTSACYFIMYCKVRNSKQSREVRRRRKSVTEDATLKQWDEQVTRTIGIIFIVLFTCSLPHMVVHILHLSHHHPATWLILHIVFWLQFCVDPIVYLATSQQYRSAAREYLKRFILLHVILKDIETAPPINPHYDEVISSLKRTPRRPHKVPDISQEPTQSFNHPQISDPQATTPLNPHHDEAISSLKRTPRRPHKVPDTSQEPTQSFNHPPNL